jgi:ADP-ribose pyrophosphatase YjhB (NUDIX family)
MEWAREIQALSQTGYHYAENDFDRERYKKLTHIAAEMLSLGCDLDLPALTGLFMSQKGYATPRVDVRAAVFQGGKLLMVRERMDGCWCMPGGWADVGDIPSTAAEREAWEEAGFRVKARKVIGVYDANRSGPLELFHAYKIIFLCDLLDGAPTPSSETSEVAFFAPDEIPACLSGERTKSFQIADAFAALADPDLPTVFD